MTSKYLSLLVLPKFLSKMEARVVIPYRELANILKLNSNKIESIESHVKSKFKLDCDELEIILAKIRLFYDHFKKKLSVIIRMKIYCETHGCMEKSKLY